MTSVHLDVHWQGEHAFLGRAPDGRQVLMGSLGEQRGLSPMELLLASVAGCSGVDVVMILRKMRVPFTDLRIAIQGERRDEHPRVYVRVHLTYHVWGPNLDLKSVERAVRLSLEKYCSAAATVAAHAEITYDIVLHPVEDKATSG